MDRLSPPGTRLAGRICRAHVKCLWQSAAVQACARAAAPTLVVWGAACAVEACFAHVAAMPVSVGHAPARNGHGPIAVRARHCTVGSVVAQVARGPARDLRRVGGEGGGGRVELVGEGTVRQVLWWGRLLVVVMVGCVGQIRVWLARGCKGRHGSSALWYRGTRAVQGRRISDSK
jgi:hypothetical protein